MFSSEITCILNALLLSYTLLLMFAFAEQSPEVKLLECYFNHVLTNIQKVISVSIGIYKDKSTEGERDGIVVEHWTPNQELLVSHPTGSTLCP